MQLDGVTLFRVRGVSSLPADVRASAIQDRLIAVARNSSVPTDSLRAVESNGMMRILGGNVAIMAVVDADASMEQVGRAELAASRVVPASDGHHRLPRSAHTECADPRRPRRPRALFIPP